MSLRPLHDRILVQRLEAEETAQGGLIIPDTAKEKPRKASSKLWATARFSTMARDWK